MGDAQTSANASSEKAADSQGPDSFSAENFFATQSPPQRLQGILDAVRNFVETHARAGHRVVLITVR